MNESLECLFFFFLNRGECLRVSLVSSLRNLETLLSSLQQPEPVHRAVF